MRVVHLKEKMINFYNVTKEYPDGTVALDNVNLEIEPGEFLFVVGPSGAGKSTLFKLLIREEVPTSGEIYFGDDVLSSLKRNKLAQLRRDIGVVFQDFKLLPSLTVSENIAYPLQVIGKSRIEIDEIVPEVLNLVDLGDRSHAFPKHLSGGEKQRLAIARAISTEPRVLIADEPTGNIDHVATWAVMDLLMKINEMGTIVMMTTHDVEIVNKLKKRVVSLDRGKITKDKKNSTYQ